MAPSAGKPDLKVFDPNAPGAPAVPAPPVPAATAEHQKPGPREQQRRRRGEVNQEELGLAARAMAEEKRTTPAQATGLLLLLTEEKYLEWVAKGRKWKAERKPKTGKR